MSALEDIVKRGSGDSEGNIDPRMLGYKTSIFPDVSAILIIKDVEQFHHRARHIDRRLRKRPEPHPISSTDAPGGTRSINV